MANFDRTMQSEERVDPEARAGVRRFLSSHGAEETAQFVRACLKAVDRVAAVAIYNRNVHGMPMPASSDRGRIAAILREVLRAGRPDGFECLQELTSHHLEEALDRQHQDAYSEAVEALNEAAEAGDTTKIRQAAGPVIEALRSGLDDDAIERYVVVHALNATIDPLLEALGRRPLGVAAGATAAARSGKPSASQADTEPASAEQKSSRKAAAEKATAQASSTGKTDSKKASTKKASGKKASSKKASTNRASSKKASSKNTSSKKAGSKKAPPPKTSSS